MSTRIPVLKGRERPGNLGTALREAFVAVNDLVLVRLAERGHGAVRSSHSVVFQYLDDAGTTVSVLADRAQMTKQAMAELVAHLEAHGYVTRLPNPQDRRSKLVMPTSLGHEVIAIAQGLVPELEERVTRGLSEQRVRALRVDLEKIRRSAVEEAQRAPTEAPAQRRPRRRSSVRPG